MSRGDQRIVKGIPKSNGCVTHAAKQEAEPPNQKGYCNAFFSVLCFIWPAFVDDLVDIIASLYLFIYAHIVDYAQMTLAHLKVQL